MYIYIYIYIYIYVCVYIYIYIYIYTRVDPCIPCTKRDAASWVTASWRGVARPFESDSWTKIKIALGKKSPEKQSTIALSCRGFFRPLWWPSGSSFGPSRDPPVANFGPCLASIFGDSPFRRFLAILEAPNGSKFLSSSDSQVALGGRCFAILGDSGSP